MVVNNTLMYSIINLIFYAVSLSINGWWTLSLVVQFITMFTLVPRFILNLRELYARNLQSRCGSNIDTAFGLTSASSHDPVVSAIMFAEDEQSGEQSEEIQMERRDIRCGGSGA